MRDRKICLTKHRKDKRVCEQRQSEFQGDLKADSAWLTSWLRRGENSWAVSTRPWHRAGREVPNRTEHTGKIILSHGSTER